MLGNIGPLEIGIVLVIALLVFGPKKLPELGSSMGRGIREFGHGIKGEGGAENALEAANRSAEAEPTTTTEHRA
jgi:sec-independent protein translocase protein TatA